MRLIMLFFGCWLAGCSGSLPEKTYRIGFSQCTGDDKWKNATLEGVKRELSFHPGTELIYKNAQDNSERQISQIRELMNQHIDILLVSPNEAKPLTPVVEEAYNRGIPVVVIDRKTTSDLYTSFVGVNNFEIGKMAGNYIANLAKQPLNVIEVIGLRGSTPSSDRHRGFLEGIRGNSNIHIKEAIYGDWLKEKTSEELLKIKDRLSAGDLVFAQNDPMALGAYEVYKSLGLEKSARFIGIDGLSGPGGGIQFVANKILQATLLNPTGGEEAIQIAFRILGKEPFNRENILPSVVIDSTNVRIMTLQTDKINGQQRDIENQQGVLNELQRIYNNQRTLLYVLGLALLLVFILGSIASYSLWNNRKKNKRLAAQNQEILDQKNLLEEMTARAKEATDAKFNFFTNISHEFRTPLTLILGPLQDSLSSPRLHFSIRPNLELIHKNAIRLLRLINQLMDFRKMEESKMKLRASENNLPEFILEIANAFQVLANKKSISFNVICRVRDLKVWFDVNMLDKVLFNLLSNAFKFSNDHGGIINITVDRSADGQMATVVIEDTGVGMTPEESEHAFDAFYQGHKGSFRGTGLGLSLSKELINLHHGHITVTSEKWKGTTFTFCLPLGKTHLKPEEMIAEPASAIPKYEDIKIYTTDAGPYGDPVPAVSGAGREYSILIIEDNADLVSFLQNRLGADYEIHEAQNGKAGLNLAYDMVPDLIICDIILPEHNGLHITATLKQDIRTSHIPIILLTAKGSMEEQIEGIRLQADAFIVKPFNLVYLEENIRSLLKNRALLREHYTSELPSEMRSNAASKIDRKFINEFKAIVENKLSDEDLAVEDICREIGISRVQLYRKVKALLGCNVNDYILNVRLQKARYLLANEDLPMSEVAFRVGFSSQAYFSTVFKSRFSLTPSEFRDCGKKVK
jgi:signal transduction histidine kinase/AraC-like DNA-binding protein/ABC-type xylose transport system substrate-binding protein